jgi:hypothetical protein
MCRDSARSGSKSQVDAQKACGSQEIPTDHASEAGGEGGSENPKLDAGSKSGVQPVSNRLSPCHSVSARKPRKCLAHQEETTKIRRMDGCAEGRPERIPPSAPTEISEL